MVLSAWSLGFYTFFPIGSTLFGGGNKPAFGATSTASGGLFGNTLSSGNQNKGGLFGGFGGGSNLSKYSM